MSEEYGVKESLEIIAGAELVGVNIAAASIDGFDLTDIKYGLEIAKMSDVLVAAVKDAGLSVKEAKDLSSEELMQLGAAAYTMVQNIIKASKKAA